MPKKFRWSSPPTESLRANAGFDLSSFNASLTPGTKATEKQGLVHLRNRGEVLSRLQECLYANGLAGNNRSILLVLQGMDTAGKGGITRHVLGMVDPQGVEHRGFGKPTEEERAHHYMWRIENALPSPGKIGVFDRSHYEEVLIVRVHELVPKSEWSGRYDEINEWEARLVDSGTTIVKCAMMVSLDEQLDRLDARLHREDKFWKYNPGDLDERERWPEYMAAYQALLDRTSTDSAPWHVIPADHKWFSRLAITELLISALESLNLEWPEASFDVGAEKQRIADLRGQ